MAETHDVWGFTLTCPLQVHFAFNPWYFDLAKRNSNADSVVRAVFQVAGDTREPFKGNMRFDIRRWMQNQFDGVVEERLRAICYGSAVAGAHPCVMNLQPGYLDAFFSDGTAQGLFYRTGGWYAIWGSSARGEEYGGSETLRWWFNYPLTLDCLALEEANAQIDIPLVNGESSVIMVTMFTEGGNLYSPAAAVAEYTAFGSGNFPDWGRPFTVNMRPQVHLLNQDLTSGTRTVTLVPDCTPVGARGRVYLRWIDSMGRIRYWLFTQTDTTEAVSATAWNRAEQPEPELYTDGINDAQLQRQELTAVRTRTLAASLLSDDDYAVAGTVVRSPLIDEFDGYDADGVPMWHRVNIVAGSYTRDRSHLQDFTFQITDRTQTTQSF